MPRKSIDSRLDRLFAKLLPPGSRERAEYYLPDDLSVLLANHRAKTARIIDRAKILGGPGHSYELLLAGRLDTPPMPAAVAEALDLPEHTTIITDHSVADAARFYAQFALGDGE